MMPSDFKLDTLVTMLACLSSSQTPASHTSLLSAANTTASCPAAAFGGLTARMQQLTQHLAALKDELGVLQEQLVDMRRNQRNNNNNNELHAARTSLTADALASAALPTNCWQQKHGIVRIRPSLNAAPFFVYCDQRTRGGGWLLLANRYDGSESFNRGWQDYKIGFGPLTTEFFIGLEKLHVLTNSDDYELLIVMRDRHNEQRFALYDLFSIGNEQEKYLLYVLGAYAGDAGDSLRYHAGKKFTTYDQDNDENAQNCARAHAGAWWYGLDCFHSNLFGTFQGKFAQEIGNYKGILWKTFLPGPNGSLSRVQMLIRAKRA